MCIPRRSGRFCYGRALRPANLARGAASALLGACMAAWLVAARPFPMPVIAAMNGHTFGNGSILACSCDYRFMKADRGFFCFPEVDVNIPFLPSMLQTIRKAIPYYKLEELIFSGKRVGAKELEEHHVLVKACDDAEALMRESLAPHA